MKNVFYKLVPAFLLVFFFTSTSFSGCQANIPSNDDDDDDIPHTTQNVCGVENPLTDLEWLSQMIAGWAEDAQNGFDRTCRIYQCNYENDKIGFLIEPCVNCPDAGYELTDCQGNLLCILWGEAGDSCAEYNVDFENKQLIYQFN